MTVVLRSAGTAELICDRCGAQDRATAAAHDHDVVWPLVARVGWTGSPFATGTHRCPQCEHAAPEATAPVYEPPAPAHGPSYGVQTPAGVNAVVLTPLVDIDGCFIGTLRDGLTTALDTSRHVVLDLHAVHLIDSAGLGLLVRIHQEAKRRGGSLSLVAPSRFVLTVLHTMRLGTVFATYPHEEAALRAVRQLLDRR